LPSDDPDSRFADIIENIDAIASYTRGLTQEQFSADRKTYDATERCLARISEAASKLGLLAPDQPWNNIRGIGNWLRHDYSNVLRPTIWKTVVEDLTPLRAACERALLRLNEIRQDPSRNNDHQAQ
jgi:uncharacterized protein with HEPN domain